MKICDNITITKDNIYHFIKWKMINNKTRKTTKIFSYSNRDLNKVMFIKNYYLENGKEKTQDFINNNKDYQLLYIQNISNEKNVTYCKTYNKWQYIYNKSRVGLFDTKEEAIKCKELVLKYGVDYVREHKKELFPKQPKEPKEHYKTIQTLKIGKYKIIIKEEV